MFRIVIYLCLRVQFFTFKLLFDEYLRNGDREKFYGKYYPQIPLKSTSFFRGLSRNSPTLLAIKVADSMLVHCKRMNSSPDKSVLPSKTVLSEKEKAGLQYLGGYVLHNLHEKRSRTFSNERQQVMAILKIITQEYQGRHSPNVVQKQDTPTQYE